MINPVVPWFFGLLRNVTTCFSCGNLYTRYYFIYLRSTKHEVKSHVFSWTTVRKANGDRNTTKDKSGSTTIQKRNKKYFAKPQSV